MFISKKLLFPILCAGLLSCSTADAMFSGLFGWGDKKAPQVVEKSENLNFGFEDLFGDKIEENFQQIEALKKELDDHTKPESIDEDMESALKSLPEDDRDNYKEELKKHSFHSYISLDKQLALKYLLESEKEEDRQYARKEEERFIKEWEDEKCSLEIEILKKYEEIKNLGGFKNIS